jgi:RimJ/RimL family protein N-acetyltransferase
MKVFVETERLILRELLPEDENGMWEMDSDPEVHKYLGNDPVTDMGRVRNVIAIIRQQYIDNGIGRWAMINKYTGSFMGWTGLKLMREESNGYIDYYDLGYRILRKYWGHGFATESAIASLVYGFEKMALNDIYARANILNLASQNVLLKSGMKQGNQLNFDGIEHYWYSVTRDEWKKENLTKNL